MSATTQTQPPIVPPRPSRAQDVPKIPPRPARRAVNRSVSPSRDRFAPSPLNDTLLSKSPSKGLSNNGHSHLSADPIDRSGSVDLPSLGEEGAEYEAVTEELSASKSQASSRAASPEHTRTIGDDIKLHAPKPSLPAVSAKQRVAAVTRTDSDKAASFGIGQPSDEGTKKKRSKASTASQDVSNDDIDDEQGIPEIGIQVPMYPNAGDVQAPSPATVGPDAESTKKYHNRKKSARGFGELPPGSYGLHGHGVLPSDKLEQEYYRKHPELAEKELTPHHSDSGADFSRSSAELNKLVRETASHGSGLATHDINGTPSEQVGWQAIDESTSRPASVAPKGKSNSFGSQSSPVQKNAAPEISLSAATEDDSDVIHVDEPNNRRKSVMFSDDETPELEYESEAPILAPDEVAKDPSAYENPPAVEPAFERRLSSFDEGEVPSRPTSRPSSRPGSIFKNSESAIVEDKAEDEYEPLFKDDNKQAGRPPSISSKSLNGDELPPRFPSRDIWEDAPSSAYYTAVVSTPDLPAGASQGNQQQEEEGYTGRRSSDVPPRSGETPAQAFARHQEELAEQELRGPDALSENRKPYKASPWVMQQPHLASEIMAAAGSAPSSASPAGSTGSANGGRRPPMTQRFPSRDVWEDAPESLQLQTVVSNPQDDEVSSPADATKPDVPQRPARKSTDPSDKAAPVVPSRPKPKVAEGEASQSKPVVPERPKPQVPNRPVRQQLPSADQEPESVPRSKPAVPARPFGGKIAQLQANFMSDLNKKLKIGPQAPKKEEPPESTEEAAPEAEKAPLVDARKGRARGPQRRAPRSSPSPAAPAAAAAPAASASAPVSLGFSTTTTLFSIDPEEGVLNASDTKQAPATEAETKSQETKTQETKPQETVAEEKKEEAAPKATEAPKPPAEKVETLATNMAGETLAEAKVTETDNAVEPEAVDDNVVEDHGAED